LTRPGKIWALTAEKLTGSSSTSTSTSTSTSSFVTFKFLCI